MDVVLHRTAVGHSKPGVGTRFGRLNGLRDPHGSLVEPAALDRRKTTKHSLFNRSHPPLGVLKRCPTRFGRYDAPSAAVAQMGFANHQPVRHEVINQVRHDGPIDEQLPCQQALSRGCLVNNMGQNMVSTATVRKHRQLVLD
nr:hypothetical protein [Rhodococcus wratislaviensis]